MISAYQGDFSCSKHLVKKKSHICNISISIHFQRAVFLIDMTGSAIGMHKKSQCPNHAEWYRVQSQHMLHTVCHRHSLGYSGDLPNA